MVFIGPVIFIVLVRSDMKKVSSCLKHFLNLSEVFIGQMVNADGAVHYV